MTKARQLADLGNAYDDGALSHRNLVINGAMQVAQRGTSFSSADSDIYGVDRMKYQRSNTSGRVTLSQDAGLAGVSPKSVKIEVTTVAAATPPSSVFHQHRYAFEGNDINHLGLGTSDCKDIVLSFYAKASTTGTLPFGLTNSAGSRSYANTFDITEANTWKRYVYKVPPVTDGSWGSGTSSGLELRLGFEYGSNYTGATAGQWSSMTGFANFVPTYTNALASTLNATLNITGLQLEVGDTATPFEHRSYGDELARCQRYYQALVYTQSQYLPIGFTYNSFQSRLNIPYAQKRANPTVSFTGDVKAYYSGTTKDDATLAAESSGKTSTRVNVSLDNNTNQPSGNAVGVLPVNSTGLTVSIDAEL